MNATEMQNALRDHLGWSVDHRITSVAETMKTIAGEISRDNRCDGLELSNAS